MNPYSVLLVEDELPARTVFRMMIQERSDLFAIVAEASDGEEGLRQFREHSPQLIVTDITMPGMGGLDMIRELKRETGGLPLTLILSCHQDFGFAQQAIHVGASAYLVKDDCLTDPKLLVETMSALIKDQSRVQANHQHQMQLEQTLRSNQIEVDRNRFLDMLRGQERAWLKSLAESDFPLEQPGVSALLIELDLKSLRFSMEQSEELKLWQFAGINVLNELLGQIGPHKAILHDKARFIALVASSLDLSRLPEQIIDAFNTYLKMNGHVVLTHSHSPIASIIPALRQMSGSSFPFFYLTSRQVPLSCWEQENPFQPMPAEDNRHWLQELKQIFIEQHRSPDMLEELKWRFHKESARCNWQPDEIKSLYLKTFLNVLQLRDNNEELNKLEAALRNELNACQTFFAVHESTLAYFQRSLAGGQGALKDISASIARIIATIHEDISYPYKLEEVAASFNYSVPYFSASFKRETGEGFLHYITQLRIEKAKLLLLTTSLKTYEIAAEIGLPNYRHFNRVFKKMTGMSPSEFAARNKTAEL
ncbi:helix-turn-helix domain-containing protein [Paenibacillus sp. HB172176]|uniref:response regulator transcription factor n=1 Tax=Paenibacillus sp. HB172176 TaxID=2493690 RepID=UPI00143A6323|nr:helix-turn-helix domain-containing protein [Paenibacillus sp. HB172176]